MVSDFSMLDYINYSAEARKCQYEKLPLFLEILLFSNAQALRGMVAVRRYEVNPLSQSQKEKRPSNDGLFWG